MDLEQSALAAVDRCPNEEFRTGPSANLPDCRAYELVTPEELGRTQAITFTEGDEAIPSVDGEHLALKTFAPLEPNPDLAGTRAIFSRTAQGWVAKSIESSEVGARGITVTKSALSPDLSQIVFRSEPTLNGEERRNMPSAYEFGPVGGPYTLMADIPGASPDIPGHTIRTYVVGANAGTASVPAFTDVLFESNDHQILPEGPERTVADETEPSAFSYDLYDWTGGALRLVNVAGEGSNIKKLNACGTGSLGAGGEGTTGPGAVGGVSADGSKIFFESCGGLYMRLDGRETIEVSAPQGVALNPGERRGTRFNAASADGSEVVFNTATPLLAGETTNKNKLFIYNTVTHDLKLIANNGLPETEGTGGNRVLISEDGSAVYYNANESIYRYETQTGITSFVAAIHTPHIVGEPSYTTPNGRFLVFVSGPGGIEVAGPDGLELEPRGADNNELYRYDAADGSVECVSCGEGPVAPSEGKMLEPFGTVLETEDETPPFVQMSEDGGRVFFQTTARLVPQDTNSTEANEGTAGELPGMDVYEWEANGVEEAPGVVCGMPVGCTHLLTSGEDVGRATFLGASKNGRNVFFATAARLAPQATPEFPNIYDARVEGGFPPPKKEIECTSCQGVGSTAPLFGPGASGTFTGAGNAALFSAAPVVTLSTKTKGVAHCGTAKGRKRNIARCARAHPKGKGRKRARRALSRKKGGRS